MAQTQNKGLIFMKKYLCILISVCFIFLTFSSCKNASPDDEENTTKYEESDTTASTTEKIPSTSNVETKKPDNTVVEPTKKEESESENIEINLLPLPQKSVEFSFLSGAGAWRTLMVLHTDGTFTGQYLDSEMGEMGESYPNGSAYISTFSGKFEKFEKINKYSYKMTLVNTKTEKTVGDEWIEDGIRYVASEPYGLEEGKDFILYLPETPINMVPTGFLTWWPYRYGQNENPRETLGCYGILNVTTEYGFFYAV